MTRSGPLFLRNLLRWSLCLWLTLGAQAVAGRPLAPAGSEGSSGPNRSTVTRRVAAMGTTLDLTVEARSRSAALRASEAALRAVEAARDRLSTWRSGSELARINAAPAGVPAQLSPALERDLRTALLWAHRTGGAFSPTVGALARAWGLRSGPGAPLVRARAAAREGSIEIRGHAVIRATSDVLVDAGGFGKGVALDDAARAALASGAASIVLDFGGQVLAAGDVRPVLVRVADPDRRDVGVLELRPDRGSLATSGNSERAVRAGGRRIGHILDPRTGRPARDFGSVTVWAGTATAADCLSTALYVLGPRDGLSWAERHSGVEALYLVREGRRRGVLATDGMRRMMWSRADHVSVAARKGIQTTSPRFGRSPPRIDPSEGKEFTTQ